MATRPRSMTVLSYLIALTALCVAVGYADALATFYVRGMLQVSQEGGGFARAVVEAMPERIVGLEQTRQAATVLLLISVGFVAGRNAAQQVGTVLFALGGWEIFRYVAIRTITDWPTALGDADAVIFLPQPVYVPVWMPIVIALGSLAVGTSLIRYGALVLRRSRD